MDLEQATVHRLHKSSRLLMLSLLLLLPIELPIEVDVRIFPGLERLFWFVDLGVAFVVDFIAVADLFLEAGVAVIIVDVDFDLAATEDDDDNDDASPPVTAPPLLLA